MTALAAVSAQAVLCTLLAAIARERARAFYLPLSPTGLTVVLASIALAPCLVAAGEANRTIPAVALTACAAVSAATDLETGLIFDRVLGVTALLMITSAVCQGSIVANFAGAASAAALLALPHAFSGGRAMGLGDVKFAAVIGFALGPASAVGALCIASIAGGAVAIILLSLRRAHCKERLAFGPFLAAGAALAIAGIR